MVFSGSQMSGWEVISSDCGVGQCNDDIEIGEVDSLLTAKYVLESVRMHE